MTRRNLHSLFNKGQVLHTIMGSTYPLTTRACFLRLAYKGLIEKFKSYVGDYLHQTNIIFGKCQLSLLESAKLRALMCLTCLNALPLIPACVSIRIYPP